jgi:hypothetical protein
MALESVTNIDDLNASNPTATDPVSEGDDHIRNIKTALKTNFPSITGNMTCTQAELNVLDGVTAGTVLASGGVVVDASKKVNEWLVDNLTLNGNDIASSSGDITLTPTADVSLVASSLLIATGEGIRDGGGDEFIKFTEDTTPITHLGIRNADTGLNPVIEALGEADTGIDFVNSEDEKMFVIEPVDAGVNWLQVTNSATGNPVIFSNEGEDDVGFTFNAKNGEQMLILTATAAAVNEITINSQSTGVNPEIRCTGEADTGITMMNSEGEEIVIFDSVATSVNELTIRSAATGNKPIIAATGEADNGVEIHNDQAEEIAIFSSAATSVNEITVTSAASGADPSIKATGDDTNINLHLDGKGTGGVSTIMPIITKTQADSPYTVLASDTGGMYINTSASGSCIFTLPAVATSAGVHYHFTLTAAQLMSVTSNGTETIYHGANSGTAKIESGVAAIGDSLSMFCDGSSWYVTNAYPTEGDRTVSS